MATSLLLLCYRVGDWRFCVILRMDDFEVMEEELEVIDICEEEMVRNIKKLEVIDICEEEIVRNIKKLEVKRAWEEEKTKEVKMEEKTKQRKMEVKRRWWEEVTIQEQMTEKEQGRRMMWWKVYGSDPNKRKRIAKETAICLPGYIREVKVAWASEESLQPRRKWWRPKCLSPGSGRKSSRSSKGEKKPSRFMRFLLCCCRADTSE
ncbi:uncharacterized protein [Engystomops pustulosus]|uniref:uncharacterized protein isoform X5 n=1 Tax=Engystomops pustulosus TaxID=76066 RepID=UPI003AFA7124